MPRLIMLIGVPGSGKTTWIRNHQHDAVVISSDDKIEAAAAAQGLTYSAVFAAEIKAATAAAMADLQQAVTYGRDIILDQTNLTVNSRRSKLNQVPHHYQRIALLFPTPHSEQLACVGIPFPVWYKPAPHMVQFASSCIPMPVWYLPGTQSEQFASEGMPLPV